jgi:hypothetical protein
MSLMTPYKIEMTQYKTDGITIPLNCGINTLWQIMIHIATSQAEADRMGQTGVGMAAFYYRLHNIEYLIKHRFNHKFRIFDRLPKQCQKEFRLRGDLMVALYDAVERVSFQLGEFDLFLEMFTGTIMENIFTMEESLSDSKKQNHRLIQQQNRKLEMLENPFNPEQTPYTHRLFRSLIEHASQSQPYRVDRYSPLIKRRMAVTTYYLEHGLVVSEGKDRNSPTTKGRGRQIINLKRK